MIHVSEVACLQPPLTLPLRLLPPLQVGLSFNYNKFLSWRCVGRVGADQPLQAAGGQGRCRATAP